MAIIYGQKDSPTLDLNFAKNKSLIDTMTGRNLVTFSRTQTGNEATYVGADGLIKYASADEPRFDHNPETGESLGLLVEESRTNLLPNSATASAGFETPLTTQAYGIAPDGTQTSIRWLLPSDTFAYIRTFFSVIAGKKYTLSIFLRGSSNFRVTPDSSLGGGLGWGSVDLSTRTTTGYAEGVQFEEFANGWVRMSFQKTATATGGAQFNLLNTFSAAVDIEFWGPQVEEGSSASSYIPTEGGTKTRSADVASITGSNFSSFYNNTEGTWFTDMAFGYTQNAGNPLIFGGVYYTTVAGGAVRNLSNQDIMVGLSNSQTIPSKTAVALKSQDFKVYRDGTQTGSNNSLAYTPTGTQWLINSSLGSLGRIKRLTYWPKRLPDTTLQRLTR